MEIVKISVFLIFLTTWTWANPWDYSEYSEVPEEIDDLNEESRSSVQSNGRPGGAGPTNGKPVRTVHLPNGSPLRVIGLPNGAPGGNSGPSRCMTRPQIQQQKQKQRQQLQEAIKLLMQLQKQLQMQPQECRSPTPSLGQGPQRVQADSPGGFRLDLGVHVGRSGIDGEDGDPSQTLDHTRENGVDSDEYRNQFGKSDGAFETGDSDLPEQRTEGDTYGYLPEEGGDERSYSWGNDEGQIDDTTSFYGHPEEVNYISNRRQYGEW